jgi:hypothetical protein
MRASRRWNGAGILVLAIGIAGCGGSSTATGSPPSDATNATSAPAVSEAPVGQPGNSPNSASVTIGAETYTFKNVFCRILAPQYIQAVSVGGDPQVSIVLPPDGWEDAGDTYSPPSVQVQIGEEFNPGAATWLAGDNGSVPPGISIPESDSRIDSYQVPDTTSRPVTATGTATFVDLAAIIVGGASSPVEGSFSVTCA